MTDRDTPTTTRPGRGFRDGEGGAAAILLAIVFPLLIGGMALGSEVGYWFLSQRQLQQAADLGAHAAAVAKRSGAGEARMREAAVHVAAGSGYRDGADTLSLFSPPAGGGYAGDTDGAEVRIIRQQERYFTRIYASGPVELSARAVAAVEGGASACLLALSRTAPGAVTVSGSTDVTFDGCDIASNSNASDSFNMNSGASVFATGCVNTVGGSITTAGLILTGCSAVNEGASPALDPYAGVAEPAASGPCENGTIGKSGETNTVTPTYDHPSGVPSRHFCSGLKLSGNVTLEPGLYIVEGGSFQINSNAVLAGTGVTFFLGDGVEMSFNGSANFDFSAPETGPFAGMLVFGSRTAGTVQHKMNGTTGSVLNGALYTPASHMDFTGDFSSSGGGCTQIVASTVLFTGNSALEVDCQAVGTKEIKVRQEVKLVE